VAEIKRSKEPLIQAFLAETPCDDNDNQDK